MTTRLPRVGSLELHTSYVLVRDLAGAVERIAAARIGAGRMAGLDSGWSCARYDVHAPVRAESAMGARMEAV